MSFGQGQRGIHEGPFQSHFFLEEELDAIGIAGGLQFGLNLLEASAKVNTAQGPNRPFERFWSLFLVFLHEDGGEESAIAFGFRQLHDVLRVGSGFEESFDQRLRSDAFVQALGLQDVLRLPGWIELFFCAIAGGETS